MNVIIVCVYEFSLVSGVSRKWQMAGGSEMEKKTEIQHLMEIH